MESPRDCKVLLFVLFPLWLSWVWILPSSSQGTFLFSWLKYYLTNWISTLLLKWLSYVTFPWFLRCVLTASCSIFRLHLNPLLRLGRANLNCPLPSSVILTPASFLRVSCFLFLSLFPFLDFSANDVLIHNPYVSEILSKVKALTNGFSKDSCANSELSFHTCVGELQAEMVHDIHKMASLYSCWQYNQSELVAIHKQLNTIAPK